MDRFLIIYEETTECEWEFFDGAQGEVCLTVPQFAILDSDNSYDPDYANGIHIYHLCAEHVIPVFTKIVTGQDRNS